MTSDHPAISRFQRESIRNDLPDLRHTAHSGHSDTIYVPDENYRENYARAQRERKHFVRDPIRLFLIFVICFFFR